MAKKDSKKKSGLRMLADNIVLSLTDFNKDKKKEDPVWEESLK